MVKSVKLGAMEASQGTAQNRAQEIAGILLDIGAVKVSANPPFTWTSGIKSPVYCDNRKLISYPRERQKIIGGYIEMIKEAGLNPEFIGGTATAAIPWAAFVAHELKLPMIYIRPQKKEHGGGKQIEGDLPPGKRVLIIEDLISTGGSSVSAADAVREECKGTVTDILAIMTWELAESAGKFADAGLNLFTLTNFTNIIELALERGVVTKEDQEKILEFKKGPRDWAGSVGL